MYISSLYQLYSVAYKLVSADEFTILHIDARRDEIWLEKYNKRKSTIVRFIHKGFNWKNELKVDMERALHRLEAIEKSILGKEVEFHSVYVSTYPPVDSWETLKQPVYVRKKKAVTMHMYYVDETNGPDEINRLSDMIDRQEPIHIPPISDIEKEDVTRAYKQSLLRKTKEQKHAIEKTLFYGKARLVYLLMIINVFYFVLLEMNGGSMNTEVLIEYGAKYNPAIIDGEWWRIISSMFMHIGLLHLGMNMLALYYLGTAVEQIFGSKRFILIYMLAGIGAGTASFALTNSISAGASGAIFGMFGALLYFGSIHRELFLQTMGTSIFFIIAINLVFGFTVPAIDNSAHIGGLVAGLVAAMIIQLPKQRNGLVRTLGTSMFIAGLSLFLWFGFTNDANMTMYELTEIEQLQQNESYNEVIRRTSNLLAKTDDFTAQLLFQRSYAQIMTHNYDDALADLEQIIELEETMMPEAYYNAALIYVHQGNEEVAIERVERAYELQPENEDIETLYNDLVNK